jgi:hypothetical protein
MYIAREWRSFSVCLCEQTRRRGTRATKSGHIGPYKLTARPSKLTHAYGYRAAVSFFLRPCSGHKVNLPARCSLDKRQHQSYIRAVHAKAVDILSKAGALPLHRDAEYSHRARS